MQIPKNTFTYIKSTIDKIGKDISVSVLGSSAVSVDLDSAEEVKNKLAGRSEPALVWRILDYSGTHVPSLKNLVVAFAPSVVDDEMNIRTVGFAGVIHDYFCKGRGIEVIDYTEPTPQGKKGTWAITDVDSNPQINDGDRGYKFVVVSGIFFETTP